MTAVPTVPEEKEETVNKGGRPKGSSTKISKMQRIANRLEEMARLEALPLIQQSLEGKVVEKERLTTAKWTVTASKDFHNTVLAEKKARAEKDEDGNPTVQVDEDDENAPAVFSLKIVESK